MLILASELQFKELVEALLEGSHERSILISELCTAHEVLDKLDLRVEILDPIKRSWNDVILQLLSP